jgi:hypothetical protein
MITIDNIFLDVAVEYKDDQILSWSGIKPGS